MLLGEGLLRLPWVGCTSEPASVALSWAQQACTNALCSLPNARELTLDFQPHCLLPTRKQACPDPCCLEGDSCSAGSLEESDETEYSTVLAWRPFPDQHAPGAPVCSMQRSDCLVTAQAFSHFKSILLKRSPRGQRNKILGTSPQHGKGYLFYHHQQYGKI